MRLKKVNSVALTPTVPFAFDSTFHKPDHFTSGDNQWQPGIRWQTWFWQGKQLGLKFISTAARRKPPVSVLADESPSLTKKPQLLVEIYYSTRLSKPFVKSLAEEIEYRFNLRLDLSDFYQSFKDDKVLGPVVRRWRGMRPGHPSSLYEYLIIGIVLQNATVRRSIQMFQALLEKYGRLLEYDGKKLWCFWEPGGLRRTTEEELRALKVGYRAKSIKRTDDYFAKGLIDEFELRQKDRGTQREELIKLYGVGPATVWYLLFDVFHHWDFFDHVSPWEQKIYSKLFFNQDPEKPVSVKKILKHIDKYGEYKQLAVHYLWEDLWWKRKNKKIPWLEKLIRV